MSVDTILRSFRSTVDEALERLLPAPDGPARRLAAAMRYAVLCGGKRLRPLLTMAACEACGGAAAAVVEPAAALEMIHAYSLIHDDLPAMDDDDLRRGHPTVHRAFDEAAAILAGDSLLTLAFEILATRPEGERSARHRAHAVAAVASRAGLAGMVGGQEADLAAEGRSVDRAGLEWIHRHKTGALLSACVEVGAIHADAGTVTRAALARYGECLGLAFQIADDILDLTATAEILGKTPGKDRAAAKATYPALLGIQGSRGEAALQVEAALAALAGAGIRSPLLEHLARWAITRTS